MIKLYSDPQCPNSHRTRIVLSEKELPVDTTELEPDALTADFLEINPYGKLPTVIDRDIVFFEPSVVNEYLDERYPHPPLKVRKTQCATFRRHPCDFFGGFV